MAGSLLCVLTMAFSTVTFLSFPLISYPHHGLFSGKHVKRIQLAGPLCCQLH